ncbi:zinc ribbon domain-containing protein [Massilia horti]|uniref:Uncharacterized protein n=1 Tax=Massilia horti TaxID=2562153 RepID=A0A4Y9SUU3_9BURK|nr:zinc ribbon domain-containing protein [Massilia horti]TFW28526.1 hypothetical protein E4O92_21205 [Massilia horti]
MSEVVETPVQQKQGSIHKCPSCGASLGAFVSTCASCGHELLDVEANRTITSLAERFAQIERDVDALGYKGYARDQAIIEKKGRVIRDFAVPNSREDLQQLIYYIQPRIVASVKPDPNVEDWRAKFIEVLNLAKHAYKDEAAALAEFAQIEASLQHKLSEEKKIKAKRKFIFFSVLGVLFILYIMGSPELKECEQAYAKDASAEKSRLENLYAAIEQDVRGKDFIGAKVKAGKLRWELETSCKEDQNAKMKVVWQETAEQVAGLIRSEFEREIALAQGRANRQVAEKEAVAYRQTAEHVAEEEKTAELQGIESAREKAAAAKAATDKREAATEQQW